MRRPEANQVFFRNRGGWYWSISLTENMYVLILQRTRADHIKSKKPLKRLDAADSAFPI
jgi:hypothetical protein